MADRISENLAMLMRVVAHLAPLRERLVFLGGAVTEFFITLPGARRPRQTKDVVAAHLLPDAKSQERLPLVLDRIRGLITAGTSLPQRCMQPSKHQSLGGPLRQRVCRDFVDRQ